MNFVKMDHPAQTPYFYNMLDWTVRHQLQRKGKEMEEWKRKVIELSGVLGLEHY